MSEPILQYFAYSHLPPVLAAVSKQFHDLAHWLVNTLPRCAERHATLRKLLESKDAAVRAALGVEAIILHPVAAGIGGAASVYDGPRDPITGQPLPAGSPYSAAHKPVDPQPGAAFDPEADRTFAAHQLATDPHGSLKTAPSGAFDLVRDWTEGGLSGDYWSETIAVAAQDYRIPSQGLVSWSKRHHGAMQPPDGTMRVVERPDGTTLALNSAGVVIAVRDDT
jgi:hypothetical protein